MTFRPGSFFFVLFQAVTDIGREEAEEACNTAKERPPAGGAHGTRRRLRQWRWTHGGLVPEHEGEKCQFAPKSNDSVPVFFAGFIWGYTRAVQIWRWFVPWLTFRGSWSGTKPNWGSHGWSTLGPKLEAKAPADTTAEWLQAEAVRFGMALATTLPKFHAFSAENAVTDSIFEQLHSNNVMTITCFTLRRAPNTVVV